MTFIFPGVADMDAIGNASDQHLFLKFFDHLGIDDDTQLVYLSTLLRSVFDETSKLDKHLAKYGATLHCAVSRMVVSKNPREAPSHRWIRVLDRLGFFTDGDKHAERIVNIGMSFAYRQLEVDALADANAVLLRQTLPTTAVANDAEGNQRPGGEGGSTATGNKAAAAGEELPGLLDEDLGGAEVILPPGGLFVSSDGTLPAGHCGDGGEPPLPAGGTVVSTTPQGEHPPARSLNGQPPLTAGAAASGVAPSTAAGVGAQSQVSLESTAAGGGLSVRNGSQTQDATDGGARAGGDQDGPAGDADDDEEDAVGPVPHHVVYERQPTVVPPASAVAVVASVLRTVASRSGGPELVRKLFDDSLLCAARTGPPTPANRSLVCPTGNKADWTAVGRMCTGWWPQWIATPDLPTLPPVGTIALRLNRKRLARTSRWAILVDMSAINATLVEINVTSSRFFPKAKLAAVEEVLRISAKTSMRLPVVVAGLLLLCTKEERFAGVLTELASVGRVDVNKAAPLHEAARHEFFSAGLSLPAAANSQGSQPPRPATADHGALVASVLGSPHEVDMNEKYTDMDAALKQEDVEVATQNRADRMKKMRASTAVARTAGQEAVGSARAAPQSGSVAAASGLAFPAVPPPRRPALPQLRPAAQGQPVKGAATSGSQRSAASSASKPPRGVKRARTARRTAPKVNGSLSATRPGAAGGARAPGAAQAGGRANHEGVAEPADGNADNALVAAVPLPSQRSGSNLTATAASRGRLMAAPIGGEAGAPAFAPVHGAGLSPGPPVPRISQISGVSDLAVPGHDDTLPHLSPPDSFLFDGQTALPSLPAAPVASSSPPVAMVAGSPSTALNEGGGIVQPAPVSPPLSFVEESRARQARVESDLRDAHASVQHILQARERARAEK